MSSAGLKRKYFWIFYAEKTKQNKKDQQLLPTFLKKYCFLLCSSYKRRKFIQGWNNLRLGKWWQTFNTFFSYAIYIHKTCLHDY